MDDDIFIVDNEELASHELNRAGTKPVLFPLLGIPWVDFIVICYLAYQCWTFRWQLLIPLLAGTIGMIALYRRDHYAGRRMICWGQTSALCLTGHYSGGTAVAVKPSDCFRGVIR